MSRGRKPKALPDTFVVVRAVFFMRYGSRAIRQWPANFGRKPGTVDGYLIVEGDWIHGGPPAECTIEEACKRLELTLKSPRRRQAVHPITGEFQEWDLPALIAKRCSDQIMPEGEATRRALYRALRWEKDRYAKLEEQGRRDEWNRRLAERRNKKR